MFGRAKNHGKSFQKLFRPPLAVSLILILRSLYLSITATTPAPFSCDLQRTEWLCPNTTTCIELAKLCNGRRDCPNGADEGPGCKYYECRTLNGGCSHQCTDGPNGKAYIRFILTILLVKSVFWEFQWFLFCCLPCLFFLFKRPLLY